MAEGGHDPCGQNINPSSEPIIKKNALLAGGDDVSQNFDNATVNVIAGDQTTTTVTTEKSQIQISPAELLQIDRQIPKAGGQDINTSAECNTARHATLAEGTHISQDFTNATVNIVAGDQHTTVINEIHVADPHDSSEKELDKEKIRLEAEQGFLAKTMIHLRKEIQADQELVARPTMMVIDMMGTSTQGHDDDKSIFGRDLEEISLHQIHDPHNAKPSKHVTILGEAGAGKTTLMGIYSLDVADGKVKTLDDIQLVHFVSADTLQSGSSTTAFRLLFMEQMAQNHDTKLSLDEQEAGAEWLENNSSKILLTIDGLDQCSKEFGKEKYTRVSATTLAKANDIIANIMSGTIWPDARVLTTTRWNTYWNMKDGQKPDKVVGLRGLNDVNMEKVIFSQPMEDVSIFINRISTSPKLRNLCRNPMSLCYMMQIFQGNNKTVPDTLSGLISAFFRQFISPSSAEYYDDITNLAYDAMQENKFVFEHRYLSRHGIDPNVLNDFLSTGAILEDGRDTATSFDKFSRFSHQTMQEFCCALHVPNLTRDEVKAFVTNQLNDSRMELTRQLLYGLILDDKVTKPMSKYLAQRSTSIQECRKILIEELDAKMKNGTIREIQTIRLLRECGHDTITELKQNVKNIVIYDRFYLLQDDPFLMASMIQRLSPLEEVFVDCFVLEPSLIETWKLFFTHVDVFKVGLMVIADRYLTQESLVGYLNIFRQCHSDVMTLFNFHLTQENLEMIAQVCNSLKMQIPTLHINKMNMPDDAYRKVAFTLESIGCQRIWFADCGLTKNKLSQFYTGCKEYDLSLSELSISDGTMAPNVYSDVAAITSITRCSKVIFKNCDLTKQKLECFSTAVKENPVAISKLELTDAKMSPGTYREIPVSLKSIDCKEIRFRGCNLTKQKLTEFYNGCKDNNLSLLELLISDGTMEPDVYRVAASIISITGCSRVFFGDCELTEQKLRCFGIAGKEKQISLQTLQICDVKMEADGYREVAVTLKSIGCEKIRLDDCNLTIEKLSAFYTGCEENALRLSKLVILDRTMTSDAYSKVAAIICITRCSTVFFGNCDLTKEKLECFGKVVKRHQASLSIVEIEDVKMPADCYREFSTTLDSTGCEIIRLQNCNLTKRKLYAFYTGCKDHKLSLSELIISDAAMAPEVYCDVAAIISITGCSTVYFENCDLTARKLRRFGNAGKENQLSLSILTVVDAKMTAESYREVAFTLKYVQCKEIRFCQCRLTRWKLSELQAGCKDNDSSLRELTISDRTMLPEAYLLVPAVAKAAKCDVVYFTNCELSKQKLEGLGLGCKESQDVIRSLEIDWSNSTASEDLISALCDLMKFSVERLTLHKWIIDARWIQRLEDTLQLENSKTIYLQFPDSRMVPKLAFMIEMLPAYLWFSNMH